MFLVFHYPSNLIPSNEASDYRFAPVTFSGPSSRPTSWSQSACSEYGEPSVPNRVRTEPHRPLATRGRLAVSASGRSPNCERRPNLQSTAIYRTSDRCIFCAPRQTARVFNRSSHHRNCILTEGFFDSSGHRRDLSSDSASKVLTDAIESARSHQEARLSRVLGAFFGVSIRAAY